MCGFMNDRLIGRKMTRRQFFVNSGRTCASAAILGCVPHLFIASAQLKLARVFSASSSESLPMDTSELNTSGMVSKEWSSSCRSILAAVGQAHDTLWNKFIDRSGLILYFVGDLPNLKIAPLAGQTPSVGGAQLKTGRCLRVCTSLQSARVLGGAAIPSTKLKRAVWFRDS